MNALHTLGTPAPAPAPAPGTDVTRDLGDAEVPRRRSGWASLLQGLSIGALLLTVAVACATIVLPKLTGAVPLTVLSNSMSPGMPVGALAVVRPTMDIDASSLEIDDVRAVNRVDDIRLGDVIAYQPSADDSTLIMHRVIGVTDRADGTREFLTQGDNNAAADPAVEDYMVRGEVSYHLPLLGYVNSFVNGNGAHHTMLVILVAVGFYGWAGLQLARALRRRKA